jgi:hypothetical protein
VVLVVVPVERLPSVGGDEQLMGAIPNAKAVEAATANKVARRLI